MEDTYLSIIVTTRNDNHGGDLLKRTKTFLNGLIIQCNRYKIKSELIFVEWNPPADRPLLKDVLPAGKDNTFLKIRYIVVPAEIHQQYKFGESIPLYQMIAKNVGIRRAEGTFVLCTNIDLLFSNELMQYLSEKTLRNGSFYRANRCDIPKEVMDLEDFDTQIAFSKKHIISRHGRNYRHKNISTPIPHWLFFFSPIPITLDFLAKNIKKIFWNKNELLLNTLDFDACGDFTLMSKEDWLKIDGYAEIDLYSLHVDSMALISAKSMGLEQVILKPSQCTFHIFHKDGWTGFENPLGMITFLIKKPSIDWHSISSAGSYLLEHKINWELNKPDWGFKNEYFKEYISTI